MTFLHRTLAVVLAASCVWLIVRIVNRRERWAKITLAVIFGLPLRPWQLCEGSRPASNAP